MSTPELNLGRVSIDGFVVHRLSATLHPAGAPRRGVPEGAWWVSLACGPMPERYAAGPAVRELHASTISGHEIRAAVRILERRDDHYGTELILCGLSPLPGAV